MAQLIKLTNGSITYLPVTVASAVQYSTGEGNTPISVQDAIGTVAQSLIDVANNANGSYMSVTGATDPTIKILTPNGTVKSSYQFKGSGSGTGTKTGHITVSYTNGVITFATTYTDTNDNYYDKITDKGLSGYEIATITANGTGSSSSLHVPQATTSHFGVVKLGYTDANNANKGYALKLDSNGKGYVNVPWTDTVPNYSSTYAPYTHTHGNIQSDGKINNGASKVVVTDSTGKIGVSTNITTTELDYLENASSNIQSQIDNINSTISSGMHMRGTTTTVPGASTAYVIGDSYVYSPSTATATITIPAAQSQSGNAEVVGKGDMITYIEGGKWAVIQNNIGDYVSSIKVTDDNTWIEAIPTTSSSGAVTIDIKHIGPGTGSTKNATKGTDGAQLSHNSSMVMTGINWKADAKGHVTEISYTLAKLPADADTHNTSYNIVGASNGMSNSAQSTNGNVYLKHIEGKDNSFSATSSHNIKGTNGIKVTSDSNGNISITPTSIRVVTSLSYDSPIYAIVGKDMTVNEEWFDTLLGSTQTATYFTTITTENDTASEFVK